MRRGEFIWDDFRFAGRLLAGGFLAAVGAPFQKVLQYHGVA